MALTELTTSQEVVKGFEKGTHLLNSAEPTVRLTTNRDEIILSQKNVKGKFYNLKEGAEIILGRNEFDTVKEIYDSDGKLLYKN